MIRKLRIKFVCAMMSITAVMLLVILGVVIHSTQVRMDIENTGTMRSILASPFLRGNLEDISQEMQLPFFLVQLDRKGNLIAAPGSEDLSSRDIPVEQIVSQTLALEEDAGYLKEYDLRFYKERSPMGYVILFSDAAAESQGLRNMVITCALLYLAALAVFLVISILLSHWAIRPVETAWDQQRQFVADASHELKTPLSILMANAELLQSEDVSQEERQTFSRNILSTTYQMRSLVEAMLEMARVDNGAVKMQFSPVDFSQLVTDAVLSFQLLYQENGLELRARIQEGVHLSGSEQHLYQVLDVLLDNGLKYAAPGSTVHVTLTQNGRSSLLAVSSVGQPLSREELELIFKRFYRADKARARNGSYGLGLAIAQSVVQAHKGRIWAQSQDGVNTFFVQLPALAGKPMA